VDAEPDRLCLRKQNVRERIGERIGERDVTDDAVAEERALSLPSAIDCLVGNDEVERRQLFLETANRGEGVETPSDFSAAMLACEFTSVGRIR
jgi:hypothetical protein